MTFHEHLDECEQCREKPHSLCFTGALLLRQEALKFATNRTPEEVERDRRFQEWAGFNGTGWGS
jgi:hypothetical protein